MGQNINTVAISPSLEIGDYAFISIDGRLRKVKLSVLKNLLCSDLAEDIEVERARITALAALEEGSTTGDAELIDARVDKDGKKHDSVGEHIRNVTGQLSWNKEYTWGKYAVLGEYELVYTSSSEESETSSANTTSPVARILYKTLTLDSATGKITLSEPLSDTQSTGVEQFNNYAEYPYYYGDYSDGSTDSTVYKYKSISRTTSTGTVTIYFWKWSSQKVSAESEVYEKGDFVSWVYSDGENDYPDDGVQDNYWYTRKTTKAEQISFNCADTQLTADNVQDALIELWNLVSTIIE